MCLFDIALTEVLLETGDNLAAGMMFVRFADDISLVGSATEVFKTFADIKREVATIGLSVQHAKTTLYVPATVPAPEAAQIIPIAAEYGITVADGVVACGSPIGTQQFCEAFSAKLIHDVAGRLDRVVDVALSQEGGDKFSVQAALVLVRFCICPNALVHFLRTTPQRLMGDALKSFDDHLVNSVLRILKVPRLSNAVHSLVRERLNLDLVCGGAGLPSLQKMADTAFFSSFALVASLAHRVLPPNFDPDVTFPDAKRLLNAGIMSNMPDDEQMGFADFFLAPVPKLQAILTRAGRSDRSTNLLKKLDKQGKADQLSRSASEASSWLTVIPGKDAMLATNNTLMRTNWRRLLDLPVTTIIETREPDAVVVCGACVPLPKGTVLDAAAQETIRKSALIKNDAGKHIFSCSGGGHGSVSGLMKGAIHNTINKVIEAGLRRTCSRHGQPPFTLSTSLPSSPSPSRRQRTWTPSATAPTLQ